FVYNRPQHTENCIKALSNCNQSKYYDLIIFSDGPKNVTDIPKVQKVREYLTSIRNNSHFNSVTIYESKTNKGLANSVISGVSKVINKYGRVIVIEDDT